MQPAPPVLAVLRHALADPLSAATVKAEVLTSRLLREAPALAARAGEVGADLAAAGRLLDLLSALSAIAEEAPERTTLGALVAPFDPAGEEGGLGAAIRVRPSSAADAVRRVVAFGTARGGAPVVTARRVAGGVEAVVGRLGPAPRYLLERLLLLPRDVPGVEELFLARAAVAADGGTLDVATGEGGLEATLRWPEEVEG